MVTFMPMRFMKRKIRTIRYLLVFLIPLVLFVSSLCAETQGSMPRTPSLQFCGAAQMVGGSCTLIDTGNTRLLIDFGLYYGTEYQEKNHEIPFDPGTISYVILTHAHMDHAGRLPLLFRKGFRGRIIATDATKTLTGIMLEMSLNILEGEGIDFYTREDVIKTMDAFMTLPYESRTDLEGVSVRFRDAGHIMGSAIAEVWITHQGQSIKIIATGDLGSGNPLLREPGIIEEADYILIESTYGATKRPKASYDEFGQDIQNTLTRGGSVLIPAFVLEKTQKLLYIIGDLKRKGIIKQDIPVIADGATGREVTKVYRKYTKYYNERSKQTLKDSGDPLSFPGLHEVKASAALRYHDSGRPAIYLTSSGMLDHANAPKHLVRMIENPKNLVALVGWQAPESLGRKLQEGAHTVTIPLTEYTDRGKTTRFVEKPVLVKVKQYSQFSSHMDGCETLRWLSHIAKTKKVFVIHGDKENAHALTKAIETRLGFHAVAPALNETISLTPSNPYCFRKPIADVCSGLKEETTLRSISDQ